MDFQELREKIIEFRDERDWMQFHTIKDLLLGLNIEVSELQEIFLWKSEQEIKKIKLEKKEEVKDELSDILIFLVYLSEMFDIDLVESTKLKIEKNARKYPIDKSKGKNLKYNELK